MNVPSKLQMVEELDDDLIPFKMNQRDTLICNT